MLFPTIDGEFSVAMLVYQRVILDNDNDYDNDIVTMIMILFYDHHHCCCHHTERESERVRKFFQLIYKG